MIVSLNERATFTIPAKLRKLMGIKPGDTLEAHVENGELIVTPVAVVPRKLRLSDSGVKKEQEAEKEIQEGKYKTFDNPEDLLKDLHEDK